MCGIVGYVGNKNGSEIVVSGLKRLEYRGYDSWGVAVKEGDIISIRKEVGKISDLQDLDSLPKGNIVIGHTRWATHGSVTKENAHPHTCCKGSIAVVHNGIIENYQLLKKNLAGHRFSSETDTEVIAHMIEENMRCGEPFDAAVRDVVSKLEGRFAFLAINADSAVAVAAKKGSPLVIGIDKDGTCIASDVLALSGNVDSAVIMEDGDLAVISREGIIFTDDKNTGVERIAVPIKHAKAAEKGVHAHFMIKEILEQKSTIKYAINQPDELINKVAGMINNARGTFFIGCGTAAKVASVGSYLFAKIAKKHVNAVIGSEFPNYHDFLTDKTLLVCISQSGETADTLEAIEVAKKSGCKVISIVNVDGSTMIRASDEFLLCNSGPEKAVCSTKVTTAQIAIMILLAYACAGKLKEGKNILAAAADKVDKMLDDKLIDSVNLLSSIAGHESMYIIGRSLNYPIALEGAIKMQEVPYIHAEGFAGGELKHGPLALITKGTPCIALVANDDVKNEMLINALEIKSRGGFIIGIAPENNEIFDFWLEVPDIGIASPIANIIPIQLLSYYSALKKGLDPDLPRNLAKSVTVK